MKIQFLVDRFKKGMPGCDVDYWEDAETIGNETPEECAKRIVDNLNNTLRPGEDPRTVVGVRIAPEQKKEEKEEEILRFAYASWYCKLTLYCPYCQKYLDLNDSSDFPELHEDGFPFSPGESKDEDDLKRQEAIKCPRCEHKFKLEGIGY